MVSSTDLSLAKESHIAITKFKREENDSLTICTKENRGEIIVNRVNDDDSQHRDYFLERKINRRLGGTVINSLRGLYKNLIETSTL